MIYRVAEEDLWTVRVVPTACPDTVTLTESVSGGVCDHGQAVGTRHSHCSSWLAVAVRQAKSLVPLLHPGCWVHRPAGRGRTGLAEWTQPSGGQRTDREVGWESMWRRHHVLWLCWQEEEEEEGKEGRGSLTGNCLPGVW